MTRRARFSHTMHRIDLRGNLEGSVEAIVQVAATQLVLYCVEGVVNCRDVDADAANVATLAAGDALQAGDAGDVGAPHVRLALAAAPGHAARVFVAHINPQVPADE